jgi:methyl-accepting chemotaxis protein
MSIPGLGRQDEVGRLARALDSFKALFAADQQRTAAELERARETQLRLTPSVRAFLNWRAAI